MTLDRLRFANLERFGKLMKTWATGKSYLDDGKTYPLPQDLEEFERQNVEAQTGLHVPDWAKKIAFVTCDEDTLVIRVPAKRHIEESEARLSEPGASYPLPDIYKEIFGGVDPVIAKDRVLDFHACRIGEYTSSFCI